MGWFASHVAGWNACQWPMWCQRCRLFLDDRRNRTRCMEAHPTCIVTGDRAIHERKAWNRKKRRAA